jgi:SAM-dependent methyltransferase
MFRSLRKAPPAYVEWNGLRLPPRDQRFCTEEWKDDAFFVQSAKDEVKRLSEIAGLTEGSQILDIGSGQGRLAIGLRAAMPDIRYVGIDIDRRSVSWCQRNIAAFNGNFRFMHIDVANARYNPSGTPFTAPIQLPLADRAFDVIFLYSVFTHMLAPDVERYLSEIARLLAPGGKALFTVYAEDDCEDEAENPPGYLEELGASLGALHRVRFRRLYLDEMIGRVGLRIARFDYRSEEVTKQSAVVVTAG